VRIGREMVPVTMGVHWLGSRQLQCPYARARRLRRKSALTAGASEQLNRHQMKTGLIPHVTAGTKAQQSAYGFPY
jgi:hypothetical protein